MRDILFRAKKLTGEWVEGYYVMYSTSIAYPYLYPNGEHYIQTIPHNIRFDIDPDTLCQYTGLDDKNNVEIYEGDIIRYVDEVTGKEKTDEIEYNETHAAFCRLYKSEMGLQYLFINEAVANKCEVIGNLFDNPELLEAAE